MINYGRVILGGLVTGVILNIGEVILNGFILAKDMDTIFRRCGFARPGTSFYVIAVAITFALGITIVLGYAAIRPRFDPGPKTAIVAALFAWFGVYVYGNVISLGLGIVPSRVVVITLAWGLVEYLIATLAGAAIYAEA